jgi:hypothetical protein
MKTETERLKENEKQEIPKSRYALVFPNRVEGDTEEESKNTAAAVDSAGGHLCLVCD